MIDNRHFIRFLNELKWTVNEMGNKMGMTYGTARNRVETLNFTTKEYCALSRVTCIAEEELIQIVLNKKSLKDIVMPYALTKEIAWEKFIKDDDFIRLLLECAKVGAGQKSAKVFQEEINMMKKHLALKSLE